MNWNWPTCRWCGEPSNGAMWCRACDPWRRQIKAIIRRPKPSKITAP